MPVIRAFQKADWPAVWQILKPVFRAGKTYAIPQDITEEEARNLWTEQPSAVFVTTDEDGLITGTYYIKPNQAGPGDHVCNCGYVVAEDARGKGVASAMCEHSQQQALAMGFRAMQYNCVVASNKRALRLWKKHGFAVIGTLPKAFRHPEFGLTDALVMYKWLEKGSPDDDAKSYSNS
jgi:L-amino acid N-acyltransferase YncA